MSGLTRGTWLCVTTKERPELTKRTLSSIRDTVNRDECGIIVVDCGSEAPTRELLQEELKLGLIDRLILNRERTVPQWQKCYAIRQALGMLEMEPFDYFGWIDNDLEFRTGWIDAARHTLQIRIIDSEHYAFEVAACHQDERHEKSHPTVERFDIMLSDRRVFCLRSKQTANGACWIVRRAFFDRWGLPPVGLGKCELGVEDWFYSRKLQASGRALFGVIDGCEHLGYDNSQRLRVPKGTVWTK